MTGIAGTVARLNVAVMELAAGQLTPADSLSKWWRSLTTADTWQSLDCDAIFPKYKILKFSFFESFLKVKYLILGVSRLERSITLSN